MTIVGVSGSPIEDGNTDRLVKALLEGSGKDYVFVNLSTLRFDPCKACAHLCARTNMCPVDDDLKPYLRPILDSEALVLGTPVHAANVTGWMFNFITRLWCFHHVRNLLRDKPVLLVLTGLFRGSEKVVERFQQLFVDWNHPVQIIGHIYYASQTPPCFKCGMGNLCKVGGLWALVGFNEEKLKRFRVTRDRFKQWEDDAVTVGEVAKYARMLAEL